MSTTFAIFQSIPKLNEDGMPDSESLDNIKYIEIAFRGNGGYIHWLNNFDIIAGWLHIQTPVYPVDNSAQGIYTIKDLFREINEAKK